MAKNKIVPENIKKPYQLLAVWFVALLVIFGGLASGAKLITEPAWLQGAFGVAAILSVPYFLFLIYKMQTRYRTQMMDDEKYSEYLIYKNQVAQAEPSKHLRSSHVGKASAVGMKSDSLEQIAEEEVLPLDYYFLNHTSFLRLDKQEEFQQRTQVPLSHYDIQIIVDSYYKDALKRIKKVEYLLDFSFPEPIRTRSNYKNNFLLKELANGEFVLKAKIFLKGREEPILIQRYLTLWESGPRLS
ncbi:MAG: hypothetical protein DWQ07_25865 [Chloroflexi bacterium]|nr:MAG: hypothetical protein DWQ07_25865 [Chloroflexota bacterium]